MKFLIWFLCIFANAAITVLVKEMGFTLGVIPTVILFGSTLWLARTLCNKWDEYKWNKTTTQNVAPQESPSTVSENNDQIRFCRKCGEELLENSRFCRKCGTEIVEKPATTSVKPDAQ